MNLVLIGMPGAGKSRLGRILSKKLGMEFIDTDRIIREREGDISEIFLNKGEEYFRNAETEAVEIAVKEDRRVISTGGGTVLKEYNMALLKENAVTAYLKASKETIVKRTANSSRPLVKGDAEKNVETLLAVRTPLYEKYADVTVDADTDDLHKKSEEIANYFKKALKRAKV